MPNHKLPDPLPLQYHEPGIFQAWISGWAQCGFEADWSAGGWLVRHLVVPLPPVDLWRYDARVSRHEKITGTTTTVQRGYVSAAARVLEMVYPGSTVTFFCPAQNIWEFLDENAERAAAKLDFGGDLANADWWKRIVDPIREKRLNVKAHHRVVKGPEFKMVKQAIDGRVDEARQKLREARGE